MAPGRSANLPRLERAWYRGNAMVFWTHTIERRATGWLTDTFHARWREVMLHCCTRYDLVCPMYVLMPDHWHLVWCGIWRESDQLVATRFLRRHVAPHLGAVQLQPRAYDHVLRGNERDADRFCATFEYIRQNPVRKGLCSAWRDWPYVGTAIAGYPDLDVRDENHLERFWRIYNQLVDASGSAGSSTEATVHRDVK